MGLRQKLLAGLIGLLLFFSAGVIFTKAVKIPSRVKVRHEVSGYTTVTLNVNATVEVKGLEKLKPIPQTLVIRIPISLPTDYTGTVGGHVEVSER